MAEREQYRAAMNRARADTSTSDNAASRVYKDRGLSVDTDFRPNYALDQALADVKAARPSKVGKACGDCWPWPGLHG
jgi:hypothetical protein